MTRKLTFVLPFLALLIALGCSKKQMPLSPAPEVVRDLKLVEVQHTTLPDYVEAVGTVRALQTSQLSAKVAGTVVAIRVQEGQLVHQGEVLIVLDDAQQRAALHRASAAVIAAQQDSAAAGADYALAHSTLGRYQSLYEKKSVSPHEMEEVQAREKSASARGEQAQAGITQARALESEARAGLGYTRIRAPFDGMVTAKLVDTGTLASPGVPLLTLEDTHRFRLEASVDEGDTRLIKMGAPAPVAVDALGIELQGKIVQIVPAADPASRSFVVKLELPSEPRLHSGFFGRARFARGQRDAVVVPRTAVLDRGQIQSVYVVGADGLIALRYVTLGKPDGGNIEILSGVSNGDRLVASPGGRDLAGKKVAN